MSADRPGKGGHSKSKRMTDRNNFRNENVQRANTYLSDKGEVIVTPGASNDTSVRYTVAGERWEGLRTMFLRQG